MAENSKIEWTEFYDPLKWKEPRKILDGRTWDEMPEVSDAR